MGSTPPRSPAAGLVPEASQADERSFDERLAARHRGLAAKLWTVLGLCHFVVAFELALDVNSGRDELAAQTFELWRVMAPLRDGGIVQ